MEDETTLHDKNCRRGHSYSHQHKLDINQRANTFQKLNKSNPRALLIAVHPTNSPQ